MYVPNGEASHLHRDIILNTLQTPVETFCTMQGRAKTKHENNGFTVWALRQLPEAQPPNQHAVPSAAGHCYCGPNCQSTCERLQPRS
jgi:hypothetical protein